jgi:putative ABC transport system permease protein
MADDVLFAFRQLRKNPGFAAIAVITLGLGVGAAAAMFGLIQGVLLSPPPYADPGRVMLISPIRSDGRLYTRGATIGQWVSWRQARSIEPPAIYRWTFNFLVLPDGSQSMGGMVVTPNYFRVLGLRPILGREFVEAELAGPRTPPSAIILGYQLRQRKSSGDPNIIGRTICMSRMPAPLLVRSRYRLRLVPSVRRLRALQRALGIEEAARIALAGCNDGRDSSYSVVAPVTDYKAL